MRYVNLFLKAASGDIAPYVARLLKEIFSGGPASSLKVRENHATHMMDLVFSKKTRLGPNPTMEGKAEFLKVLEELIMVRLNNCHLQPSIS